MFCIIMQLYVLKDKIEQNIIKQNKAIYMYIQYTVWCTFYSTHLVQKFNIINNYEMHFVPCLQPW